ncbi:hypothetical protein HOLleu_15833 [Holothuria leucospilota]|uniref:Uncharacterized protein n=1 Tax=Holothuria leucospilota TaxID=206669 RepID=A0A9Q1C4A4_HOLLE|nr:hypothetical protein HOLleu_15833 [Holothuria leucospilota]
MLTYFICISKFPLFFNNSQNAALLLLSVVVLIVCFINLILFEITEWKYMFGPSLDPTTSGETDANNIYYAHLICLVSTIIGLVSSLVGSVYICFVLINHSEKYGKDMDQMFGDPEMCKHKYITTSPPNFGDPSPSPSKEGEQRKGRSSSWTYEGPTISSDLMHEFSVALSDVSEESEPRTVAHIERQQAFDDDDEDQLAEGIKQADEAVDINGNNPSSKARSASLDSLKDQSIPEKDCVDTSESECTALEMISTRL